MKLPSIKDNWTYYNILFLIIFSGISISVLFYAGQMIAGYILFGVFVGFLCGVCSIIYNDLRD